MFVINSDAHKPEKVGTWEYALEAAKQAGVPEERIANAGEKLLALRSHK